MTEQELLLRYRETQDATYLAQLYEPFMPLVYGSCLKYFKNEEDAQDAVMDIYEKLTKKVLTHKVEYFKSWLFIVTRNHCFEKLRKRKTHSQKESAASFMYSDEVFHPDTVNKDAQVDVLHKCLEKLDEFQKTCVEMFYFKKMSYAEIAESLTIPFNQVRSRIQNGRRNLKACMEANKHLLDQDI
ncbi:MAG: RNA polymerase sigma factor (sigma-70 family) [Saprospiraceae bacterium]